MAQGLDLTHLDTWIRAHVPPFDEPLKAEKFAGGQSNPTFKLTAGDNQYVLRRKPQGTLLASAHAVDREFKVLSALAPTNVPVPTPVALCEDESVIGSMFYIMEYLEGRIFWDPALSEVNDEDRGAIYDQMNRVMADMHMVDINEVGLGDYGKPGNYFERQIGRWTKQYRAAETETIPEMEKLIDWLPKNMPEDDGRVSLVHGDYRLDNMIFHPTEPRIIAILDWELSTLGHPIADFNYHCISWRNIPQLADQKFCRENGIPTEEEYRNMYSKHTGKKLDEHWEFYTIFNIFKLAGILQGIMGRVRDGTAASKHAEERGNQVAPLAEAAWDLVEKNYK